MTISWSTNWSKSRVWTSGKFARFSNLDQPTTANGDRFPARLSFDLPVDKLEIPEVRTLPSPWLESYTVTANSLPRFKRSRTHAYIKDASLLPRNARFPTKWTQDLNSSTLADFSLPIACPDLD